MSKKILVVDDEEDIREMVKVLLEDEGYKVSTAADGKSCLAKLKKEKYDLALIDMFMPNMSGRTTLEEIRKDPKIKKTKVAFLTIAQFSEHGMAELKQLGILDYIKKPIENEDFKKRIRKLA